MAAKNRAADREDARAEMLEKYIKEANRRDPIAVRTFAGQPVQMPCIPTGALSLDVAIGGGIPKGRITEIYGPESVGKTSLALSVAAQTIKQGGLAGIIDVEHAITPSHLRGMGVDERFLAVTQPSTGEEAFARLEEMLEQGIFDLLILDSVAALTPQAELEGEMTDQQMGLQARLVGKGIRKTLAALGRSDTAVIFINQLRMKIGVMFGNPEDTPGGKALKYAAAVRLDVRAPDGKRIKNAKGDLAGLGTRVTVKKNKIGPPAQVAEYKLIWGEGIDYAGSVFEAAKHMGVLVGDGAHRYQIAATGEMISDASGTAVRGQPKIEAVLQENPQLTDEIAALCYAQMRGEDLEREEGSDGPISDEDFAATG